ncbi:hypothetical protein VIGAN_08061700 [Vigna angularis var. angularis]|uniref:Uncharacterized protein n=1 Tax=Vigna angularis var. angularis TaxID=157739 RepID=A0A0S3SMM2_PHAAN|nr:hypothetical protein VIGAN_08061700 [Vigna angularis var. angularis]
MKQIWFSNSYVTYLFPPCLCWKKLNNMYVFYPKSRHTRKLRIFVIVEQWIHLVDFFSTVEANGLDKGRVPYG